MGNRGTCENSALKNLLCSCIIVVDVTLLENAQRKSLLYVCHHHVDDGTPQTNSVFGRFSPLPPKLQFLDDLPLCPPISKPLANVVFSFLSPLFSRVASHSCTGSWLLHKIHQRLTITIRSHFR